MKPLHVGLLVVGAALAGGLAVKMTQPQTFPASQRKAVVTPPAAVTTPISAEMTAVSAPPANPEVSSTAAPAPVYLAEKSKDRENPKPRTAAKTWPAPVAAKPKPAPVQVAKASEVFIPLPPPTPYQPPPVQAKPEPIADRPHADAPSAPGETVRTFDPPAPMPLNPTPLQVTVRQGTQIAVRLDQALSSDHLSQGDTFQASLAEPLIVDGYIVAERGARVAGRVIEARLAGRLSGTSTLGLSLSTVQTADGQKIAIFTEPWVKQGNSSRDQNVAKIGGGAALGAIIGAIAGGGAGAAIGAGVGGAAGTGAAAASRGKPVSIASETVVRFRLASSVRITERPL